MMTEWKKDKENSFKIAVLIIHAEHKFEYFSVFLPIS